RYFALASFAVFSAYSALVPPTTTARWYGGQGAGASEGRGSSRNARLGAGVHTPLGCWCRDDLVALPPPLAMNRNLYSAPGMACSSICAGRLDPVFRSSHMVSGASWEYRRFSVVYAS